MRLSPKKPGVPVRPAGLASKLQAGYWLLLVVGLFLARW